MKHTLKSIKKTNVLFLALVLLFSFKAVGRPKYVLGDIHGDLDRAIEIMLKHKLIVPDASSEVGYSWNSSLHDEQGFEFIQMGDQVNRWKRDRATLDFFAYLTENSGPKIEVTNIFGNHEAFNVYGYLFPGIKLDSILEFKDMKVQYQADQNNPDHIQCIDNTFNRTGFVGLIIFIAKKNRLNMLDKLKEKVREKIVKNRSNKIGDYAQFERQVWSRQSWPYFKVENTPPNTLSDWKSAVISLLKDEAKIAGSPTQALFNRILAFCPTGGENGNPGQYANILSKFKVVHVSEDIIFSHGGLTPAMLSGQTPATLFSEWNTQLTSYTERTKSLPSFIEVKNKNNPVHTKYYDEEKNRNKSQICPQVREVLSLTGAKKLVIGHIPTTSAQIEKKCPRNPNGANDDQKDFQLIYTDTGFSRGVEGNKQQPALLKIEGESLKILP